MIGLNEYVKKNSPWWIITLFLKNYSKNQNFQYAELNDTPRAHVVTTNKKTFKDTKSCVGQTVLDAVAPSILIN